MLATICDTLGCIEYDYALNIISTLNGNQATLSKLKEDLDNKKKLTAKLKEDVTKTILLEHNGDLELSMKRRSSI